jgi:predicted nicotinamide N-methyase
VKLGAGLGLCGILASKLDAHSVLLTDGDTHTISNLKQNIQKNCPSSCAEPLQVSKKEEDNINKILCQQLIWGHPEQMQLYEEQAYDIIIGSDIIYIEDILIPLWDTVRYLLQPEGGYFLLAYARRNVSIDLVLDIAKQYGFHWDEPSDHEGVYVFHHNSKE